MKYVSLIPMLALTACMGGGGGGSSSSPAAESSPSSSGAQVLSSTKLMFEFDNGVSESSGNYTATNNGAFISGSYADFDGVSQYISVDDAAAVWVSNTDFTFELYVRIPVGAAQDKYVFAKMDSSCNVNNNSRIVSLATTNLGGGGVTLNFGFKKTNLTNVFVTGNTRVDDNAWHHVAIVRSGSDFKMYIDGVVQTSTQSWAGSLSDNAAKFAIGRPGDCNGGYFDGQVDEFRFSTSAVYTSNFTPYSR